MTRLFRFAQLVVLGGLTAAAVAQSGNASQAVTIEGLQTVANHGGFKAAAFATDGSLVLLLDEHDGIRLQKTDSAATSVTATAHVGAAGDSGVAMALDPAGNVYVTGTTTSTSLSGSAGVAFSTRADTSTNSFLAKFDANLNLVYLTFLGAGRTSASSVAVTADAAFVTGVTYSAAFPVTASGIQQAPASGTFGNGFVERFSGSGMLVYATYLTGAGGDTSATAISADSTDAAYVVGMTAATGFPTVNGLVPQMLGTSSGFLAKLTAAGDGFGFSTFVPGTGLTSVAVNAATNTVAMTGNVSLGQFPVATVISPLANTGYQTLLQVSEDGQTVVSSEALVPGAQSFVAVGAGGSAWVSGAISTPLFPEGVQPNAAMGDSFLLHVTASGAIDQTLRVGGLPLNQAIYSPLTTTAAAPAVNGNVVALPATLTAATNYALLSTVRFDLPLVDAPNSVLPNSLRDVIATCTSGQCSGTAGLLEEVSTAATGAVMGLSVDGSPNVVVRNVGSDAATGLAVTSTGFTVSGTNCGATLAVSAQCTVALAGGGPGTITVSAANAATVTASLPATTLAANPLALSTPELDFGVAAAGPVTRTLTVANLTAATQTFSSALDKTKLTAYTITESASTCGGTAAAHTLAANASCAITLALTPSTSSANDSAVSVEWLIGAQDVLLTGFTQALALNVSATEIDFGLQYSGAAALRVPRYLYLSNNSGTALAHTVVETAAGSAFTAADHCPAILEPHTVCGIALAYSSAAAPSKDSLTLTVDGISVLLTGTTLPPAGVTGSTANPNLTVSPASVTFGTAVVVTGVSGTTQTVTMKNTGSSAVPLTLAVTGDFTLSSNCPGALSGGAVCTATIGFAPSQPGTRQGLLSVTGGSGFAPAYVPLSGTGTAILPANNGVEDLGQTYVGQPVVAWFKIAQSLTTLTAMSSNAAFGVAIVEDTGSGHGTQPASAFSTKATSTCSNCWLGVQFVSGTTGVQSSTLSLISVAGGNPYELTLTADALPVSGLLLTPVTQDFGPVAVNSSSQAMTFTLANLVGGSATVQVQSVTASGDFSVTATTAGAAPCSGSVAFTSACFLNVVFSPTATGSRTGTLTVVTDQGTATAQLSGYGLADPGVALNPSALVFGNNPGTSATSGTVAVSNTGTTPITVGTVSASGAGFAAASNCATLAPGAMCTVTVTFAPQPATASGTLSLPVTTTFNGQTSTTIYAVPLASTYTSANAGLAILPNLANFGALPVGSLGLTREFTLTNFSASSMAVALTIPRQFPLADPGACATLAAGASCVFSVSFLPSTTGEATGTVTATGTPAGGGATVDALAYMIGFGQGAGTLTVSGNLIPNSPLSFGEVTSGQSATQTLTLTNSGTSAVTVHRVTALPPFFSTTTCGATLAAKAVCTVAVTYAPIDEVTAATGVERSDSGVLTVESDAATSPYTLSLTGLATPVVSSSPASSVVLNALTLSEGSLTFANTAVGSVSTAQTLTLTNSGTTTIQVLGLMVPTDFTATNGCTTLQPGGSCAVTVSFSPTTASSSSVRSGALEISSNAGTSLEFVTLLGASSAAPLSVSPVALDFGTANAGTTAGPLSVTLMNVSATPITLGAITATGDYSISRGTCPASGATLAAGSSCSVAVTFAPTAAGTRTGTLSIASDATQVPLTVSLTGIAASAQLTVSPSAVAFGSIAMGASASQAVTLLNTGTATVTGITLAVTGANAADFAVTGGCSSTSLAANQGCTISVTYTPSIAGAEAATLTVVSSDPKSPATVALSGTGITGAGSFLLTVNGGASASDVVAQGSPATYSLLVTPTNGFTGTVALTCKPVTPAQFAGCSLLPSTVTLNGAQASSTATITTITTGMLREVGGTVMALCLLLPFGRRRKRGLLGMMACAVAAAVMLSVAGGCGHPSTTVVNSGPTNLKYAPAGTYQYTVTASSTTGAAASQTVTLNLTIQ